MALIVQLQDAARKREAALTLAFMANQLQDGDLHAVLRDVVAWSSHLEVPGQGMQSLCALHRRVEALTPPPFSPAEFIAAGDQGSPAGRRSTRCHAAIAGGVVVGSPIAAPPPTSPPALRR